MTPSSGSSSTHTTVYLPNILLDENNYPTWLFRMESFLRGQNLFGFVDGTIPCPPQTVRASDGTASATSLEYINWKTQDQSIINMIGQTLSSVAMTCAVGSKSANELWENLKLKFAAPNRQNILQLKTNLQNLRKGADDIETYLDKIKIARDALATVGVHIDDEDIVVTVLRGLPAEFVAIKTVIRAQFVSCTLGELKTLLKAAEIDIDNESQCSTPLTAMVASNSSSQFSPSILPQAMVSNTSNAGALTANASQPQTIITSSPVHANMQTPQVPPGFSSPIVQPQVQTMLHSAPMQAGVHTPLMHSNFASQTIPLSAQSSYVSIPAIPYGFSPMNMNTFAVNDNIAQYSGFFAGRGNPRPNNNGANRFFNPGNRNFGNAQQYNNANANNTAPGFNNGVNNGPFNGGGFNGGYNGGFNNGNNNPLTCQICNRVGHGARTCRSLSNFQGNNMNFGNNGSNGGCIYCGKKNHSVERCYYLIGFPDQQQQNNNDATAMLAATNNAPQFWLADTGATNHMTSATPLLNNLAPYNATDTVQIGQGVGQNTIQGTE